MSKGQGKYDSRLAAKLFMYLVDNAAKMYVKEFDAQAQSITRCLINLQE